MSPKVRDFIQDTSKVLIGIIISMVGFWLIEGREYVTRTEAVEIAQKYTQYNSERSLILDKIDRQERNQDRLAEVIKKNTEAIIQLKTALENLSDR